MRLFDLHADTAVKLCLDGIPFSEGDRLALSADDLPVWECITQVFAVFSRPRYSDEDAYRIFFKVREHLLAECATAKGHLKAILAVEDARPLCGIRERLSVLYQHGVRILTPVWRGETVIGGAYDTESGLTEFGKEITEDCFSLGILTDVSHASQKTFYEMAEAAAKHKAPLIASHSNSHAVCKHPRNLTDAQFEVIRVFGGLIGLCLCPEHITERPAVHRRDVLRHLDHWLALGGEETVAFGTDFDGTGSLPEGLTRNRELLAFSDEMARLGYSDTLIRKLYYRNAESFFEKHLKIK